MANHSHPIGKCAICKEQFHYPEEYNTLNCNGDIVDNDEYAMEQNCQNPDYAVAHVCHTCYDDDANEAAIEALYS